MKKFFMILSVLLCVTLNPLLVFAENLSNENIPSSTRMNEIENYKSVIVPYLEILDEINKEYGTNFNVPDENLKEFYDYVKNETLEDFRKRYMGYYEQYKGIDFNKNTVTYDTVKGSDYAKLKDQNSLLKSGFIRARYETGERWTFNGNYNFYADFYIYYTGSEYNFDSFTGVTGAYTLNTLHWRYQSHTITWSSSLQYNFTYNCTLHFADGSRPGVGTNAFYISYYP